MASSIGLLSWAALVAQLVERLPSTQNIAGSSPVWGSSSFSQKEELPCFALSQWLNIHVHVVAHVYQFCWTSPSTCCGSPPSETNRHRSGRGRQWWLTWPDKLAAQWPLVILIALAWSSWGWRGGGEGVKREGQLAIAQCYFTLLQNLQISN